MMVVVGKDKTDGTKEEEEHQGRNRKEGDQQELKGGIRRVLLSRALLVFSQSLRNTKYSKTCQLLAEQLFVLLRAAG